MPHVYINEQDNTRAGSVEENTNVVFIPGCIHENGKWAEDDDKIKLFRTLRAFKEAVGSYGWNNTNAIMAEKLINLGLIVLYFNAGEESEFYADDQPELESGELPVIDFKKVLKDFDWDELSDKGLYKVKFLTTGSVSSMDYAEDMLACAKKRGDCIALIDHEETYELPSDGTIADKIHEEMESLATNEGAKYAAAFSPWCKCTLDAKKDPITLPGSFVYLSAYGKASEQNPNWFAYAGSLRGIPSFKIVPVEKYGDVANGILQGRSFNPDGSFAEDDNVATFAINPISDIDPFGNIVWGNRTLMWNTEGLTASSFLNIRNLVCDIKKELYRASRKFTFEQNDDILWANFKAEISGLLDRALSGSGVRGYNIEKIDTDIKGRLKAHVKIIPIEAVEDFDLTIEMADSLDVVIENA